MMRMMAAPATAAAPSMMAPMRPAAPMPPSVAQPQMRMAPPPGVAQPGPMPAPAAPARGGGFLAKLAGAVGSAFSGGNNAPPPPPSQAAPLGARMPAAVQSGPAVVFAGAPRFAGGEAVLFDSGRAGDAGKLAPRTLTRLRLRLTGGAVDPNPLDPELAIDIFVGDLAVPRARVRVADLLRQGGERPLNLAWAAGQPLRIVVLDPRGAWAQRSPALELALG
jgi:hypothetical protein